MKKKEYKIWFALLIILVLFFLSGLILSQNHLQRSLEQLGKDSKNNINLISILVKEKLRKRNYYETRNFLLHWGKKSPQLLEITLTTKNGFKLVHYQNPKKSSHELAESVDISYAIAGTASLRICRSIDEIYINHNEFISKILVVYLLVSAVLFLLAQIILRTQKQKQQQIEENNRRKKVIKALRESESKYRRLVDNIKKHYFFYTQDKEGVFTYLSHSITEMLGYTQDEFLKHYTTYLTDEPMNNDVDRYTLKGLSGEQQLPYNVSVFHKDGSVHYLEVTETPVFDENNKVIAVEGIARDITEKYYAELEKQKQKQHLQSVIDGITDAIMVIELDYSVSMMNLAAKNMENSDFIKDPKRPKCYEISHHLSAPCSGEHHPCPFKLTLENKESTSVIHQHTAEGGKLIQVEITTSSLKDKNGNIYAIIESAHDITKLLQTQQQLRESSLKLEHLAHHDHLTKLPNRLLLTDRLNQMIRLAFRHQHKIAILFIDLDNFKKVNDSLGHGVGDIVLQKAAIRLLHCIRTSDTVARLGGDEFTVLISEINDNEIVTDIATKINSELQKKFHIHGHDLYVTSSIGISIFPDDAVSSEKLLRNADAAMYKAKESGRNTYRYYTEDMTNKAFEHILMESNLRHALKHHELTVYYQPQVNGRNNQIMGMEALVRWQHPKLGLVSPAQFIPLAEKTGLILRLGEQVFDIATKQMAEWMKLYKFPGRVAINLSGKQFQQKELADVLADKLQKNQCKPEWIELEITENYIMDDPEQAIATLQKFQDMGIETAIDDFGTGYSSLAYLKRLPINKLKIDQSFVQDILSDEDDRVIITSTILLAKNMNLSVIAEGVEKKEQKDFLLEQGCELLQGYYYSRPVSSIEMTELLKSTNWQAKGK